MKIAFLGPVSPFRGGIAQFLQNMAANLAVGHEVVVYSFLRQYPRIFFPGKDQYEKSQQKYNFEIKRVLTPYNIFTWRKAAKSIIADAPDHLIIKFWIPFFCPAYIYLTRYLKKHSNIKISMLCHNIDFHEKWLFAEFFVKKMLQKVEKVIVLSGNVYYQALKHKDKQDVVRLFHPLYEVNLSYYKRETSLKNLNIPNKPTILFLGYIKPYKGLETLIKAIPIINKTLPDAQFVVAGEAYYEIEMPTELPCLIYHNKYIPQSLLPHYFTIADVVVVPYRSATQSGIILLAYSYLKPVIASNINGLKEFVTEHKSGLLFEKENENDLAEKIISFLQENRSHYVEDIKELNKKYTWEKFTENLIEALND